MRTSYRILAYLLAAEVVLQTVAIAYGVSGLFSWVGNDGGTLDQAALDDESRRFTGAGGFGLHEVNGMMVVPLVALALLVVAFLAKVPRGVPVAGVLLGAVVAQVLLGFAAGDVPALGALHGLVALVLLVGAMHAARLASRPLPAAPAAPAGRE
jgi:hypothetical protein